MPKAAKQNKGLWTEDEHERYLEVIYPFKSWRHVVRHVGTRSRSQCVSHHQKMRQRRRNAERGSGHPPRTQHRLPISDGETTDPQPTALAAVVSPPSPLPIIPLCVNERHVNARYHAPHGETQATHLSLDAVDDLFVSNLAELLVDVPETQLLDDPDPGPMAVIVETWDHESDVSICDLDHTFEEVFSVTLPNENASSPLE